MRATRLLALPHTGWVTFKCSFRVSFERPLTDNETIAVLAYIKSTWPDQVIARHNRINADAAVSN